MLHIVNRTISSVLVVYYIILYTYHDKTISLNRKTPLNVKLQEKRNSSLRNTFLSKKKYFEISFERLLENGNGDTIMGYQIIVKPVNHSFYSNGLNSLFDRGPYLLACSLANSIKSNSYST